jgi:hypothetical protein
MVNYYREMFEITKEKKGKGTTKEEKIWKYAKRRRTKEMKVRLFICK